jgi:hypothetical protein
MIEIGFLWKIEKFTSSLIFIYLWGCYWYNKSGIYTRGIRDRIASYGSVNVKVN